jgi:hypothetical protein
VRPRRTRSIFAALALMAGVWLFATQSRAAESPGPMPAKELGTLLAACSENILSESAMAGQKGAGLRSPGLITNDPNVAPKVMLWDEMKTSPILNSTQDGVVTGGLGGK